MDNKPERVLLSKDVYAILNGDAVFPISGDDKASMPYLSGPVLAGMAQEFGVPITYDNRSRWQYVDEMLKRAIDRDKLSDFFEMFFNGPAFAVHLKDVPGNEFKSRHDSIVAGALGQMNKMLYFGGNELRNIGGHYRVVPVGDHAEIDMPELKIIDREYVRMMSKRAMADVDDGRLDSAITQSRTLLEEVFCFAIEERGETPSESGDVEKLFKQVKGLYNMHQSANADKRVNNLISGLNKIVSSIATMRNKNSDAHGVGLRRIGISGYHARLVVNAATTVAEFIVSVVNVAQGGATSSS